MNQLATQAEVWIKASNEDKLKALAALNSLPSRQSRSVELSEASYFVALEGVTRYGLGEAVKNILRGALNHAFFPSPPELRIQCDKAMEWHEAQAEKVRRRERENEEFHRQQLGVPIPRTEEGKARQQAAYAAFCASHDDGERRQMEEQERADIRARYGLTDEAIAGIKDRPNPADRVKKSA